MSNFDLPQKKYSARLTTIQLPDDDIGQFTFAVDEPFDFKSGQYIWAELPDQVDSDPLGSRRAFSLLTVKNDQNTVNILTNHGQSGYKQALFALKPGDPITIHGAFGSSFVLDYIHLPSQIFFIAGGMGIAALLPVLRDLQAKNWPVECHLFYIKHHPTATVLLDDIAALKTVEGRFDFTVAESLPAWEELKTKSHLSAGPTQWWVSGNAELVDQASAALLTGGINPVDMVFEKFHPTKPGSLTEESTNTPQKAQVLSIDLLKDSPNPAIVTDANGVILYVNKATQKMTGYTQSEIIGNTPRLWGAMMTPQFYGDLWQKITKGESFQAELVNRRKNGDYYRIISRITPIFDSRQTVIGFLGTEEGIDPPKNLISGI